MWSKLRWHLAGHEVTAVERPRSGSLTAELAWLAPRVEGRWLVGISGGATLALALAASQVQLAGAVAHEPAVGSLLPSLLTPMRAAFEAGGTAAFAATLYGSSWSPALAGTAFDDEVTARELSMFAGFEPAAPRPGQGPLLVTYGAASPAVREEAARVLAERFGVRVRSVPGAAHFAPVDAPAEFAQVVDAHLSGVGHR